MVFYMAKCATGVIFVKEHDTLAERVLALDQWCFGVRFLFSVKHLSYSVVKDELGGISRHAPDHSRSIHQKTKGVLTSFISKTTRRYMKAPLARHGWRLKTSLFFPGLHALPIKHLIIRLYCDNKQYASVTELKAAIAKECDRNVISVLYDNMLDRIIDNIMKKGHAIININPLRLLICSYKIFETEN